MKVMRNIEQKRFSHKTLLWATMILFTLMIFFGQPQKTQAQWTTPDGSGNINSTNSGNVGIGTTAPDTALHVSSGSLGAYPKVYGSQTTWTSAVFSNNYDATIRLRHSSAVSTFYTDASTQAINFSTNGYSNSHLFIAGSGNIGIGTTSPDTYARLHLYGSGGYGQDIESSDNTWLRLRFKAPSHTYGWFLDAGGVLLPQGAFGLFDYTNSTFRLVVGTGGNVGIGITNPSERLVVSGNINATGNITADGNISAKYQDVAEWVQAAHAISAGTVVILDPSHSNQVTTSIQSYDTRVAGVVSERPGITLGEAGANKVMVATTGRVRVRVDATHAPIHVGDLLVTSDVEGVAMKSEPVNIAGVQIHRPGTLIGKALEPLEHGRGLILVLLSLQ